MEATTETIAFVEFSSKGHPFSVVTHKKHQWGISEITYDFEFSKRWGLLWNESGSGPVALIKMGTRVHVNEDGSHTPVEMLYWAAPSVQVETTPLCRHVKRLPKGYRLKTLFEDGRECDGPCVFCSICQDWMPDEIECYCEHVWWCETCNEVSTPDERCPHPEGAVEEEEEEVEIS